MIAPPRSRWRSPVLDAMPARATGTEPVSERDAGVPAKPTPMPTSDVGERDQPVGRVLLPEQQHDHEAEQAEGVADQQREPGPVALDQLRRAGRDHDQPEGRRDDRRAGLERRVAEHVLQVLLADEHRPHQRAEDDDPGQGRDPEDPPGGDREVVERDARPAAGGAGSRRSPPPRRSPRPTATAPSPGTGAKLIASTSAATITTERMPPRLSTGSVVSLTWEGTKRSAMNSATTASGSVIRKTEPQSKLVSRAPATSGPSDEIAPPSADQRAIDLVRAGPGPERRDQGQRRREGHPRREAAEQPGAEEHLDRGRERRRAGTPGSTARRRRSASSCARSGRRPRPGRAPTRRGRASSRPRPG